MEPRELCVLVSLGPFSSALASARDADSLRALGSLKRVASSQGNASNQLSLRELHVSVIGVILRQQRFKAMLWETTRGGK